MNTIRTCDEVFQRILSNDRREDDQVLPFKFYTQVRFDFETVQALLIFQIH